MRNLLALVVVAVVLYLVFAAISALLETTTSIMRAPTRTDAPSSATVEGLPGQAAAWSGPATCMPETGRVVVVTADVPASESALGAEFELQANPGDPILWVSATRAGSADELVRLPATLSEATDDRGRAAMTAEWRNPWDDADLSAVVRLTWDCGRSP